MRDPELVRRALHRANRVALHRERHTVKQELQRATDKLRGTPASAGLLYVVAEADVKELRQRLSEIDRQLKSED